MGRGSVKGLDAVVSILFIGIAVLCCTKVPEWLAGEAHQLELARDALCGGERHFVYARTRYAPYLVWSPVNDGSAGKLEFNYKVIQEIIDGGNKHPFARETELGTVAGAQWSVESCSSWNVRQANQKNNPWCVDQLERLPDDMPHDQFRDIQRMYKES